MKQLLQRSKDMALRGTRVFRQSEEDVLYWPHSVDLWKPSSPILDVNKNMGDPVYVLAVAGQKCRFISTPETDTPTVLGRNKVTNMFTLDKFYLPQGVKIQDAWMVRASDDGIQFPFDDAGRFWMFEGNAQSKQGQPFQMVNMQMVYAKISPPTPSMKTFYSISP